MLLHCQARKCVAVYPRLNSRCSLTLFFASEQHGDFVIKYSICEKTRMLWVAQGIPIYWVTWGDADGVTYTHGP